MTDQALSLPSPARPAPAAVLQLLKPITWFPPMWAYMCGAVSSGQPILSNWAFVLAGILLAGPLVCGTSQAVNDWFDRHVDAINEPHRPIPSGRIPGRWGLYIAIGWTLLSLGVAAALGPVVLGAAIVGLALAWAYSAPPFRLKLNGWWGNLAVGLSYEGLAWFTGAAVLLHGMPSWEIVTLCVLYSLGAHGIMVLNDFKSVEGDIQMGVRSLPVQLGVAPAARFACWSMAVPQMLVIALLLSWGQVVHAGLVMLSLLAQAAAMQTLMADPRGKAPWYNGVGVLLYVLGMLVSAFAVAAHLGGA